MKKTRVCHWCQQEVPADEVCAACLEAFPSRPKPETMTADQREAEMRSLVWTEVPFSMIHGRIEQLVGRPVWTHEFALSWEGVVKEARWETRPATMDEIIGLIPREKLVVIVKEEA